MSESLSSIASSGKFAFTTRLISTGIVAAGTTLGDILIITPPSGQRVRLTHISTGAGLSESSISITIGANLVVDSKIISGSEPRNPRYSLGSYAPYTYVNPNPPQGNSVSIIGAMDESVTISKAGSNTVNDLYYAYELGE